MKKKKLRLKELKVKSFITNVEMEKTKGGKLPENMKGREEIQGKAIDREIDLPWNIRVHAWTISEIRNDGRPHQLNG